MGREDRTGAVTEDPASTAGSAMGLEGLLCEAPFTQQGS